MSDLRAALEAIRDAHVPDAQYPRGQGYGFGEDGGYGSVDKACQVCGTADEYAVEWPCWTHEKARAALAAPAADGLDVERLIESWRTTYDTIIHKGLMAYAVEAAWEPAVTFVGDPGDGITQTDLGVVANGIVDYLLAAFREPFREPGEPHAD